MEVAGLLAPEDEREVIRAILQDCATMRTKARYHVLARRWWLLWARYVHFDSENASLDLPSPRPTAIDNSELLLVSDPPPGEQMVTDEEEESDSDEEEEMAVLRRDILVNVDYVLVPEKAGKLLSEWYGCNVEIKRQVIEIGILRKKQVELWPLRVRVRKDSLQRGNSQPIHDHHNMVVNTHIFSRTALPRDVKYIVATSLNLAPHKIKLILPGAAERDITTCKENLEEIGIQDGQLILVRLDEPALDMGPGYRGGYSAPYVVTHTLGTPLEKGVTGLYNLGNTCFMNSALQCLSNTLPVLQYFLPDTYINDINTSNPLGSKGNLVKQFAALLKQLWAGTFTIIVPREFKNTLGRFAPQFSGYQQQDAQELIAYVLDGLHEDLNKAHLSSEQSPNAELGSLSLDAQKGLYSWEQHTQKNRSFIVDTFHGQLKSTVTCSICSNVSTTFDPFMFLSLPVPSKDLRIVEIVVYPIRSAPIKCAVRVPKSGTMSTVKAALVRLFEAQSGASHLLLADIYSSRAFIQEDSKPLYDVRSADILYAYEVQPPENYEPVLFLVRSTNKQKAAPTVASDNDPTIRVTGSDIIEQSPTDSAASVSAAEAKSEPKTEEFQTITKEMNRIAYVHCLNRRIIGEKQPRPEVFGKPLIISFDRFTTTRADIYELIEARLKVYLAPTEVPAQLIHISLVGLLGEDKGEFFPNDSTPVTNIIDETISALAIDWDRDVLYSLGLTTRREEYIQHESLHRTAEDEELTVSLSDCFNLFEREELLEENDRWHCVQCACYRPALKRLQIWRAPQILIIHLKRFQYTRAYRDKLTTKVEYPLEDLDLTQHILSPTASCQYELYSVANHLGGLNGGHYTAFVKNPIANQWYHMNDSQCSPMVSENIVTKDSYILFYRIRRAEAQSTDWLSAFSLPEEDAKKPEPPTTAVTETKRPVDTQNPIINMATTVVQQNKRSVQQASSIESDEDFARRLQEEFFTGQSLVPNDAPNKPPQSTGQELVLYNPEPNQTQEQQPSWQEAAPPQTQDTRAVIGVGRMEPQAQQTQQNRARRVPCAYCDKLFDDVSDMEVHLLTDHHELFN